MRAFLPFAMCSFPTAFEALWRMAAVCGMVLFVTASLLFWRNCSFKRSGYAVLMSVLSIGSIWSFVLAIVASQNNVICAGPGGEAGTDLAQQANKGYHTLLLFQSIVQATLALTAILLLVTAFSWYFTRHKHLQ